MAEVFGTVASALGVAGLFNNCVQCFEYVQLGRHLGDDYERCQLKLDVAQIRLSRWGAVEALSTGPSPPDKKKQEAREFLSEIELLFERVQRVSKRYERKAQPGELVLATDTNMQPVIAKLHLHLRERVCQRQKGTSLLKKAAWALYDKKELEKLIQEIVGFVSDLEELWPAEEVRRQLSRLDVQDVDDSGLAAIQDIAPSIDNLLVEAARGKGVILESKNSGGRIEAVDDARVQVGTNFHYVESPLGPEGITDRSTNTADSISASGNANVHIGSNFGKRDWAGPRADTRVSLACRFP